MPENARDNVQVPDFVLEAEAQMAKEAKEGKTAEAPGKREEVTIKFGKGLWAKIPADGTTVVTKPVLKGQDEQGKNIWEDQKTRVPNQELKSMVEAYKTRTPQTRDQKVAEPRESAREKLDALVKDTASKVSPEKTPKAKSKAKTGPELSREEAAVWAASLHSMINQSLSTDCSSSGFRTSMILPVYRMIPSFSSFFISL